MLSTKKLVSGYGKVPILHGVDFEINEGEVVSIIGRNGVGKSTFIKTVIGLNGVMDGTIEYLGNNINKKRPFERAWLGMGYVPQGHMVFPNLTVKENLEMGEQISKQGHSDDKYTFIYDYFPILKERRNQKAGTMSGGQQAMLSIARVLTGDPKLILLDEPTEGVQPNIVDSIGDIILKINEELGVAILLVEQHLGLIQSVSQRGYAMDKGRIVDSLSREQIDNYEYIKKFLAI
ncbi:ABC transporter ATP-binding protein [Butyrivibrio proteoclasticus]|uniref:ABC transporter ATP-binding protein n=1 Tax=Butyrivibrio proteoclasticus TaxID=43305 RepID=UPI00047CFDE3|nr:ABC transporter ATP-binding protein [Butyrivibrio proteoclasticus]